MSKEDVINAIHDVATEALQRKSDRIIEVAMPVIKDWVENRGATGRISVPITDGKRIFNLVVDIQKAYASECKNIVKQSRFGGCERCFMKCGIRRMGQRVA